VCVATTTIIAVSVAGASIASSQIAAKKGRDAAKKAADAQTASADQALDVQKTRYQQERADFDPYQTGGRQALAALATRASAPTQGFHQAPPAQLGAYAGSPTPAGQSGPGPAGAMAPPGQPDAPMGGPFRSLAGAGSAIGAAQAGTAAGTPTAPPAGPGAAGGALWTIQAPDGATEQLPPEQAQQFIQHGARRIG